VRGGVLVMGGGKKGGRRRGGALVAERMHRFYAVTSKPFQAAVVKCPKAKYLPKNCTNFKSQCLRIGLCY